MPCSSDRLRACTRSSTCHTSPLTNNKDPHRPPLYPPPPNFRRNAVVVAFLLFAIFLVSLVFTLITTTEDSYLFSREEPYYDRAKFQTFTLIVVGFAVVQWLMLFGVLAYYIVKRPLISAARSGRLPVYVLVSSVTITMVTFASNAFTWLCFFSTTIPFKVWQNLAFYIPLIFIPMSIEVLKTCPLNLLFVRIIIIYYTPPAFHLWLCAKLSKRPWVGRLLDLQGFASFSFWMFILFIPVLFGMVINMYVILTKGPLYAIQYLPMMMYRIFILDYYCCVNLWCSFCVFQIRHQLSVNHLDNSNFVVALAFSLSVFSLFARVVAFTVASKYMASFIFLAIARAVHIFCLLLFYVHQINSMLDETMPNCATSGPMNEMTTGGLDDVASKAIVQVVSPSTGSPSPGVSLSEDGQEEFQVLVIKK